MGERVRQVIAADGRTQAEFAAAIGLDSPKLSKALSGSRRFSDDELRRIAAQGKVSVEYLRSGQGAGLAIAARRGTASPVVLAQRVGTRFAELRGVAVSVGRPSPFKPVELSGLQGLEVDRAATLAHRALQHLQKEGLNPTADDLATELERGFGVDVAVTDLGFSFDGLAVSGAGTRLMVVTPSSHPGRHRFTMAHELGHLLFGDDQGLHVDEDIYDTSRQADRSELRANSFAAAFLMPEYAVRQLGSQPLSDPAFARLAMDLAVTPQALAYRMKSLGLAANVPLKVPSMYQAARLANQIERLRELAIQASTARPPGLLARDLLDAHLDGETGIGPYAEIMGLSPEAAGMLSRPPTSSAT